jgi:hypothetical protein
MIKYIMMCNSKGHKPQAWDVLTISFPGPPNTHAQTTQNVVVRCALLSEKNCWCPVFSSFQITDVDTMSSARRLIAFHKIKCFMQFTLFMHRAWYLYLGLRKPFGRLKSASDMARKRSSSVCLFWCCRRFSTLLESTILSTGISLKPRSHTKACKSSWEHEYFPCERSAFLVLQILGAKKNLLHILNVVTRSYI